MNSLLDEAIELLKPLAALADAYPLDKAASLRHVFTPEQEIHSAMFGDHLERRTLTAGDAHRARAFIERYQAQRG